ncbi:MAG: XdhC family protein [Planctomycetaceae bacterium]
MRELWRELGEAIDRGRPVVSTVLVETRGSTPQKSGASMLVFADGTQAGTLGGGCVEAEVKRRALTLLHEGSREILTFQLDNDYGWDDGLICGGRMSMLVDPVRAGDDVSYFVALHKLTTAGAPFTEAIIIDPEKCGGNAGDRFLIVGGTEIAAARCTGPVPDCLIDNLRPESERPGPYVVEGISYLPELKRCRLIVIGAGHVGQKVAELAAEADFDIWVVDDREQYCNRERFPSASKLIVDSFDNSLTGLEVDTDTYCIIVTRGHNHDEEALLHLAETPARYLGMIGSRRKIKMIFEDLLREGISRESLQRVHAPLGIDIGSQTVPEIAVSIVAELIAHRNLGQLPPALRRASLVDELKTGIRN